MVQFALGSVHPTHSVMDVLSTAGSRRQRRSYTKGFTTRYRASLFLCVSVPSVVKKDFPRRRSEQRIQRVDQRLVLLCGADGDAQVVGDAFGFAEVAHDDALLAQALGQGSTTVLRVVGEEKVGR